MIRNIIESLVKKQKLENEYGWRSCLEVPSQYNEMERLGSEAWEMAEMFSKDLKDTSKESLFNVCKNIAYEIANGNIDEETAEIHFYSQEGYIDTYITGEMDDTALRMFESLFYWVDSDSRGEWLKANYTNQEPDAWTDERATFVIYCGQ